MTEWEVFGVIAGLATFVIAIVTPIIKLNTTITKLSQIVEQMSKDLRDLTERNSKTHARIYDELEKEEKQLQDHETRITLLEKRGE